MAGKPKIEIIDIGLDKFDVEKEILEKSEKIKVDTNRLANLQPVSKAKRDAAQWDAKIEKAVSLLVEAQKEQRLVPSVELIEAVEISPNQLGGFVTRVQKYLRTEDKWALQRKIIKRKPSYYLEAFSGD